MNWNLNSCMWLVATIVDGLTESTSHLNLLFYQSAAMPVIKKKSSLKIRHLKLYYMQLELANSLMRCELPWGQTARIFTVNKRCNWCMFDFWLGSMSAHMAACWLDPFHRVQPLREEKLLRDRLNGDWGKWTRMRVCNQFRRHET